MPKFYFTYGTDPSYPFQGGWTEIEAPDIETARRIFQAIHPSWYGYEYFINCDSIYTEELFQQAEMYKDSNLRGHCHERIVFDGYRNKQIVFHQEALTPESEAIG